MDFQPYNNNIKIIIKIIPYAWPSVKTSVLIVSFNVHYKLTSYYYFPLFINEESKILVRLKSFSKVAQKVAVAGTWTHLTSKYLIPHTKLYLSYNIHNAVASVVFPQTFKLRCVTNAYFFCYKTYFLSQISSLFRGRKHKLTT